jgi:hypothetical protein
VKSTVEILREARAIVAENWGQGSAGSVPFVGRGGICAALACRNAAEVDGLEYSTEAALARVVGEMSSDVYVRADAIYRFNDTHTHAEVLTLFDRAIANEEAKAQEFTAEPLPEQVTA